MLPTMNVTGDLVLEDTLSRHLSPPRIKRGDLVTLQSPQEPTKTICKRVIGLPGDTICVHPDKVAGMYTTAVASGKASARESDNMADPNSLPWELEHVLVPKGHIWISGDNLPYSRDSRTHGPIPIALVRGKIWARVRPHVQQSLFQSSNIKPRFIPPHSCSVILLYTLTEHNTKIIISR